MQNKSFSACAPDVFFCRGKKSGADSCPSCVADNRKSAQNIFLRAVLLENTAGSYGSSIFVKN